MFMDDMYTSGDWLSDLAMEDPSSLTQHCQVMMTMMNSQFNDTDIDAFNDNDMLLDPSDLFFQQQAVASREGVMSHEINITDNNKEVVNKKADHSLWMGSSCTSSSSSPPSSGRLISFGSSGDFDMKQEPVQYVDHDGVYNSHNRTRSNKPKSRKRLVAATAVCTQEHVLAERKRREIMTQRFLALSALIPGLKKMDKASILGDAAKYLKELEEQVKSLEEQTTKRIVESVVLSKRMVHDSNLDNANSCRLDESFNNSNPLLELEAKASNKNVLIRVYSQKDQGLARKILNEIEKLQLTTLCYNTMPFGNYAVNITIIAQMDDNFEMKMEDLAKHLRLAIQRFLCLQK